MKGAPQFNFVGMQLSSHGVENTTKHEVFNACLFGRVNRCKSHSLFLCMDGGTIMKDDRNTSECRFELFPLEVICDNNGVRRRS